MIDASDRFVKLPTVQSYNASDVEALFWHYMQVQRHSQAVGRLRETLKIKGRPQQ